MRQGASSRRPAALAVTVLVVAIAAAAALTVGGCRPKVEAPAAKTPEELAMNLLGVPREGTLDPGVYEATLTESGELAVKCRYALTSGSLSGCEAKLKDLFSQGFKLFDNLTSISVQVDFPFRDASGNITLEKGLTARMSRATAGGVDWENLAPGELPNACDEWWQDERIG